MSTEPREALAIARRVVGEASALLDGVHRAGFQVGSKSNLRDLVTEWDTRLEELIRDRLTALTPAIPILGEEGGGAAGATTRWLVDPIDGTVNFAHGLPLYAVTIALEVDGEVVAGVVRAPALGWEFHAARGGGAFVGDEPLRVSRVARLEQAMLVTGFAYDRAETRHNFAEWLHFQTVAGACRRLGAASLDLCMVARGWLDGYWETRLHPWDLAAGALIVAEAGGRVTGVTGGRFRAEAGHAVASNGAIHEEILAQLAACAGVVKDVP